VRTRAGPGRAWRWCGQERPGVPGDVRSGRRSASLVSVLGSGCAPRRSPGRGVVSVSMEVEMGRVPALPGMNVGSRVGDVLSGAARGAVGAMAMTGMRVMTTELGLVEQTPPQALSRQRARGVRALLRRAPRRQRRGLVEAAHWAFGAGGGAAFGALPRELRRHPWAGPVYGLVVWLGFELGIAPALGLSQAKRVRLVDRLALAADHVLYGLVLSVSRPTSGS
jgi:hypothetical protein